MHRIIVKNVADYTYLECSEGDWCSSLAAPITSQLDASAQHLRRVSPGVGGRRLRLAGIAAAVFGLAGAAGCSALPHSGAAPQPVPTPHRVVVAGKAYSVASFTTASSGSNITPPSVDPGMAAVVSYAGTPGTGTVESLSVGTPLRLVFVKAGRVVATGYLTRCSVSCRAVSSPVAYDTLVALAAESAPVAKRAAVTFS